MDINELMAVAYRLDQVQKNRSAAISEIRVAIQHDPEILPDLRKKKSELEMVISVRGNQACHISTSLYNILVAAGI